MRLQLTTIITFCLLILVAPAALSQDNSAVTDKLVKTWYAVKVGRPDEKEMWPTKRSEILQFNEDGTLKINERNMVLDGKWEYIEEFQKLNVTLNQMGSEQVVELEIRDLTDDRLVLVSPRKVTEYATTPPDLEAVKPKTAPLVVESVSTIDVDEWTGLHPFNTKVTIDVQNKEEEVEATGVVILLNIDGKKILRINEDGLTRDIEVSEGPEIAGQRHFGFITDDPEIAGEIVFAKDNSFYLYRDKDQSIVMYIKE